MRLTKIEKLYAARCLNTPDGNLFAARPDIVRKSMKRDAYHEGGHFAARCFTMLELSHVTEISIIGTENHFAFVKSERNFTELHLESYPPHLQRCHGYMLLLKDLAGLGVEMLLNKSGSWESIVDYHNNEHGNDWYGEREEGSDLFKAERIAKIMSKPFMPKNRILNLADKWTLEMLQIPAIWKMVETVADKLIRRGEIRGNACQKLSGMALDSNFPTVFELPKWKRRIMPKPGELDK